MTTTAKVTSDAPLGKVLEFMRVLWSLDHGLQSASKRMEARLGITGPQRVALRIIGRRPGISAGSLATILHLHPSTLTGILRRLESQGWIRRRADPSDGRKSLLWLTSAGRAMNESRAATVEGAVRRALTKMSDEQIAQARALIEQVVTEIARDED
jgi:DNA-binding MarR family transcriptional regulator